ncbi:GntR family transcriptional regulator [Phenylobacterium sp.]|uniref:GntR family transcriptional regulator n=1 Tax=Phenylobacterium sp. TaxID=1871053 RepID=UPI0035AEC23B
MRTRDPFGEVLETLRRRVRRGEIGAGAPLIVMDLAAELGVSATPVREALAHLAGEGLIDGRRGHVRGYVAWSPSPSDLADLLRLHQAQVLTALDASRREQPLGGLPAPGAPATQGAASDLAAMAEAVFGAIISAGGGGVLMRAHAQVTDRLHPMRRREERVFPDVSAELERLSAAGLGAQAVAAVRAYHRRRLAEVVRLAALLR